MKAEGAVLALEGPGDNDEKPSALPHLNAMLRTHIEGCLLVSSCL